VTEASAASSRPSRPIPSRRRRRELPLLRMTACTTVFFPTAGNDAGAFQVLATFSKTFFWYAASVSVFWK